MVWLGSLLEPGKCSRNLLEFKKLRQYRAGFTSLVKRFPATAGNRSRVVTKNPTHDR